MQVKDRVLAALEAERGTYLSGQALAQSLQVSRNAVWKAIGQLREKGYPIQAVPNRGYCLAPESAILSPQSIARYLTVPGLTVEVHDQVTSTNTLLRQRAEEARQEGDSVGGIVECAVLGLPAGLGDPMFGGMENRIAAIVFGIPAVKGVEFGDGFAAARSRGSENNDPFVMEDGRVQTETNHAGGILGGITSGMPIVLRTAMKPTPSIAQPQRTVSLSAGENAELVIHGRHDPCIAHRAVPVVEAVTAAVLLDLLLEGHHGTF